MSDSEQRDLKVIVGVCREDNPADVDEAYGAGTYDRLFPSCDECGSREGVRLYEGRDTETGPYDGHLCDKCALFMGV